LQALEHEQQNPNIYFYLGRALRASASELTDPEEQVPLYETAIKAQARAQRLAPLDATFPLEQATLYDKLGRFEEAEQMFAIAKARDPRAVYIAQEYRAHQELWEKSKTSAPPPETP
jgi:tetratricopeptide (TPR) repeat protein